MKIINKFFKNDLITSMILITLVFGIPFLESMLWKLKKEIVGPVFLTINIVILVSFVKTINNEIERFKEKYSIPSLKFGKWFGVSLLVLNFIFNLYLTYIANIFVTVKITKTLNSSIIDLILTLTMIAFELSFFCLDYSIPEDFKFNKKYKRKEISDFITMFEHVVDIKKLRKDLYEEDYAKVFSNPVKSIESERDSRKIYKNLCFLKSVDPLLFNKLESTIKIALEDTSLRTFSNPSMAILSFISPLCLFLLGKLNFNPWNYISSNNFTSIYFNLSIALISLILVFVYYYFRVNYIWINKNNQKRKLLEILELIKIVKGN